MPLFYIEHHIFKPNPSNYKIIIFITQIFTFTFICTDKSKKEQKKKKERKLHYCPILIFFLLLYPVSSSQNAKLM